MALRWVLILLAAEMRLWVLGEQAPEHGDDSPRASVLPLRGARCYLSSTGPHPPQCGYSPVGNRGKGPSWPVDERPRSPPPGEGVVRRARSGVCWPPDGSSPAPGGGG